MWKTNHVTNVLLRILSLSLSFFTLIECSLTLGGALFIMSSKYVLKFLHDCFYFLLKSLELRDLRWTRGTNLTKLKSRLNWLIIILLANLNGPTTSSSWILRYVIVWWYFFSNFITLFNHFPLSSLSPYAYCPLYSEASMACSSWKWKCRYWWDAS